MKEHAAMLDYEKLLNPEQLEAAAAADGPILVLAAAGTGKTRTLVYRVAFLVDRGVPPEDILLLTFTNRAAREMLERAHAAAGPAVGNIWSGTFHHVCNRMLRRFAGELGYGNDFTILDRDDAATLISQCLRDLNLNHKGFPKRDLLLSWFGQASNRAQEIEDVLAPRLHDIDVDPADIVRVHQAYTANKRRIGAMDFDDLLVNGLALLETRESVRTHYQRRFRHVLVDEYQDTNLLQGRLVDILGGHHGNVMAVGDDFQCIYGWRGSDFRNILDFPKRYPTARIVKLERNYRSVPEILLVANACIAGNPEQFQKTLRPTRKPAGVRPRVHILRDGDEQARVVLDLIDRGRRDGYRYDQMAVLYRAHFHSIELQIELARARIPYLITSGIGVFEQAHVKDVLAFLRVAEFNTDRLAFDRLLGMLPGVGPRTVATVWDKMGAGFDSADGAARNRLRSLLRPVARESWDTLDALFEEYRAGHLSRQGSDAVERFIELFYAPHLRTRYDDAERRLEDLRELALRIDASGGVREFLSEVALLTNVDHEYDRRRHTPQDALRLSTVHQAKGLEWPMVIVLWAVEGMFPSSRSLAESEDDDAEERRLFYVAVTRARNALDLCAPQLRRTRDGGSFYVRPSRFVSEIPMSLVSTVYGPR